MRSFLLMLLHSQSFMDSDAPQPTLNTKPVPPPKPVSKRMSIDASSMQEVSKAFAEEVCTAEPKISLVAYISNCLFQENGRVDEADKKNNRKSLGGTFSGRNLKDRIDAIPNSPPPLTLSSPGKEPRQEPTTAASPGPETKDRKKVPRRFGMGDAMTDRTGLIVVEFDQSIAAEIPLDIREVHQIQHRFFRR